MNKFAEQLDEMKDRHAKAIAEAGVMTEQQMRDATVPTPDSVDQLTTYIRSLVERPHDYGTCCYAMSMAATAAFNYVAGKLGVTGFQASCADLDILARTRGFKWGKLLNYENLLYPQYCNQSHFPTVETLLESEREKLAELAAAKLKEMEDSNFGHPDVVAHLRTLASKADDRLHTEQEVKPT